MSPTVYRPSGAALRVPSSPGDPSDATPTPRGVQTTWVRVGDILWEVLASVGDMPPVWFAKRLPGTAGPKGPKAPPGPRVPPAPRVPPRPAGSR